MPESGTPRRWRFRLRYSLRTLLAFVTVIGVLLGYWTNQMVRKRTAVLRFYELTSHRQATGGDVLTTMGYRYQGRDDFYKPLIPTWHHPLRVLFGEARSAR